MKINPQSLDISALPSMPLSDRKQFPSVSCIYFAMSSGTVQYIGRSANLHQRWVKHHRCEYLEVGSHIAWLEISDPVLLPQVESALIEWFKPSLNREFSESGLKPVALTTDKKKISAYLDEKLKEDAEKLARIQRRSLSNLIEVLLESAVSEAKKNKEWVNS